MLRASSGGTTDSPVILLGLSDGNIDRLRSGQPIKAELRSFGVDRDGTILVIHGKTEADMELLLRKNGLLSDVAVAFVDPRLDQEAAARSAHKHILIATVGLPRSGKTTWARKQTWPIVNPDSIRLAIHGQRFVSTAEPFVWATAKAMVRSLFLAGHQHVVLDATNISRKRRDEWASSDWGLFFHDAGTPADICVSRAKASGDTAIIPVIERMAKEYEPLAADEMRW